MLGYKHTKQTIEKMKSRFVNKVNHPMFGKTHNKITLSLKSKPGNLNPIFGEIHSENKKNLMSIKKSIRSLGLYDKKFNIIKNTLIKLN